MEGEDGSTNFLKLSFSEKYFKPLLSVIISTSKFISLKCFAKFIPGRTWPPVPPTIISALFF